MHNPGMRQKGICVRFALSAIWSLMLFGVVSRSEAQEILPPPLNPLQVAPCIGMRRTKPLNLRWAAFRPEFFSMANPCGLGISITQLRNCDRVTEWRSRVIRYPIPMFWRMTAPTFGLRTATGAPSRKFARATAPSWEAFRWEAAAPPWLLTG